MPVLTRFNGMVIKMYLLGKEHNPPHIHVIFGELNGVIDIQTLEVMEGDLPRKELAQAKQWAERHKDELLDIWNTQNFRKLPPL